MANIPTVAVAKVQTQDQYINQLQSNITGSLNKFQIGVQSAVAALSTSFASASGGISTLQTFAQTPILNGKILTKVSLTSGSNTITHGLGYALNGWHVVRIRASATIYDTQDSNSAPQTTLLLTASAAVTVDIYVF